METGLTGFPFSGKTTIFNAITGFDAAVSAFTGGKNKINIAEVKVPDDRLAALTAIFKPKKTVPATVLVKDIALGVNEQGGLEASSLAELRTLDALVIVIRAFSDPSVPHHGETCDPLADFNRLLDSFIFSDYEVCERRLERLQKEGKRGSREAVLLEAASKKLGQGELIGISSFDAQDEKLMSGFRFLSAKPLMVLANIGEKQISTAALEARAKELAIPYFQMRGDLEMEIARLPQDEQKDFLADIGVAEPAVRRFLAEIYRSLNLISFLTAGEDEVRAWSITKDTPAVRAAGKIHTDLEKGFIRAEVIPFEQLLEAGSFQEAKKRGLIRLEGKDYVVKDGDVLTIRFNN
jgi:GTP-binding protein YchF